MAESKVPIFLPADPTANLHASTKQYVDTGLALKAGIPYHGLVPFGSTTATINHNLGTADVDVTVYRVSDGLQVGVPIDRTDTDNVDLTFATAPTSGQYRVVVSAGTGVGGGLGGGGGAPDAHAASHATGGSDPVSPGSIGASADTHDHSGVYSTTSHVHAGTDITSSTVAFARLPSGTSSSQVAIGNHNHSGVYADSTHVHAGADISSGTVAFARLPTGSSSITVAIGNHDHDAAYAGLTHASRHAAAGADPVTPAAIGASATGHVHAGADVTTGTVAFARLPSGTSSSTVAIGDHNHSTIYAAISHVHAGADITSGTVAFARLPTGTSSSTVAIGDHAHGGALVPAGGTADQVLTKGSGTDYDTTWADATGGSGGVKPFPPVGLTDGTTVNTDASLGTHFRLAMGGNRTLAAPSNPTSGQTVLWELTASGGARTISLATGTGAFVFGTDITAVSATASGLTDYLQCIYDERAASNTGRWRVLSYVKGYPA